MNKRAKPSATLVVLANRKCPKCNAQLVKALHEDIEVDTCIRCRGIWADHVSERDLVRIKPKTFTVAELRRLRRFYKPLGRIERVRYVRCPICRTMMQRVNWASHSGVLVDRCENHGTWFDDGEIAKLREFVNLGGIEWEKYQLIERGLSDLSSKLTREVLRLDRRIDSAYRRARIWSLLGL